MLRPTVTMEPSRYFEDEFEEFRARSFSGGFVTHRRMQSVRELSEPGTEQENDPDNELIPDPRRDEESKSDVGSRTRPTPGVTALNKDSAIEAWVREQNLQLTGSQGGAPDPSPPSADPGATPGEGRLGGGDGPPGSGSSPGGRSRHGESGSPREVRARAVGIDGSGPPSPGRQRGSPRGEARGPPGPKPPVVPTISISAGSRTVKRMGDLGSGGGGGGGGGAHGLGWEERALVDALDHWDLGEMRPRVWSLPSRPNLRRPHIGAAGTAGGIPTPSGRRTLQGAFSGHDGLRAFTITSKGLLKGFVRSLPCDCRGRGGVEGVGSSRCDSRTSSVGSTKSSHSSGHSTDCPAAAAPHGNNNGNHVAGVGVGAAAGAGAGGVVAGTGAAGSSPTQTPFRVAVIGRHGVGKSTIISKFMDSSDISFSFDEEVDKSVSILLDGTESTLVFSDISNTEKGLSASSLPDEVDAFVVMYSVEDRRSFEAAIDFLYVIRQDISRHLPIILVGNKTDLVRSRIVTEDEGRAAANTYDCKYTEVSAAIDHKIDELLVGILKQIRLVKNKMRKSKSRWRGVARLNETCETCCLLRARENVLARLFKGERTTSGWRSCDDLYVL